MWMIGCRKFDPLIVHFHLLTRLSPAVISSTVIPLYMQQSVFLGFNKLSDNYLIINHLIIIFNFYIYGGRSNGYHNIEYLTTQVLSDKLINTNLGHSTLIYLALTNVGHKFSQH